MADVAKIFEGMNFSVVTGPEAETEYYNFDALNIPANHPAREMWDTFWLKPGKADKQKMLLRTHTSPMQMRFMEKAKPPFQIVVPGRVFRYEATDMSHEVNFYQLEGLMVGKDITLANFKFIVEEFLKKFFAGQKIEFRFRPSYFPFVEPGVEVDIKLKGKWLEIMGAGMVHPRVFEYARYNPKDWQGFAFGVGLDRLAMIKYGVPDIRLFYSGDLRFLKQF
jgi:phenylalanyl-tRNA synthetase alpha chain